MRWRTLVTGGAPRPVDGPEGCRSGGWPPPWPDGGWRAYAGRMDLPGWLDGRRTRSRDALRLLDGGHQAFPAMLAAIAAAREEILCEAYQLVPDALGDLRRRYLKAIGGARVRVLLAHAYFLPDRHVVRSITDAARRGVGVRLVVPARSDVGLAGPAMRRLYRRLLPAGVEVREWPGTMLHAKVAVVDGLRLLLGGFNLDPLSLANLEALAEAEDQPIAAAGARWIEARLAEARPVSAAELPRGRFGRWWEDCLGGLAARLARRAGRWLSRG